MSDALLIEDGSPPWLPSPDSTSKVVLHRYGIPLVGVLEQHGVPFLYWCVTGHAAPESAWAYAPVDPGDVEKLTSADKDSFDDILRTSIGTRACTFAVASDDKGIIAHVNLHLPASFDTVHEQGMKEMGDRFREIFEEYEALRQRFPALQSAARFDLVPSP